MIQKPAYYYLISGLPDIHLDDHKLLINRKLFKKTVEESCDVKDVELFYWLNYPIDNINLIQLLYDKPLQKNTGVYTRVELERIISKRKLAPEYMMLFLNQFFKNKNAYSEKGWKNVLAAKYYEEASTIKNVFLKGGLQLECKLKNLIIAINGKNHNYAYNQDLVFLKGFTNQLTSLSNEPDFGLKDEEIEIEKIIKLLATSNLVVKEKMLDNLRWNWLDEHTKFNYFTIEALLVYHIKLGMIERWISLDKSKGKSILHSVLTDFRKSVAIQNGNKTN